MAFSNPYANLERRDLHLTEWDSTSTPRKTASGNCCKDFRAIQRYADLELRDLHLFEWRFHIYSKENGIGNLL
jgi:hypothetical protein